MEPLPDTFPRQFPVSIQCPLTAGPHQGSVCIYTTWNLKAAANPERSGKKWCFLNKDDAKFLTRFRDQKTKISQFKQLNKVEQGVSAAPNPTLSIWFSLVGWKKYVCMYCYYEVLMQLLFWSQWSKTGFNSSEVWAYTLRQNTVTDILKTGDNFFLKLVQFEHLSANLIFVFEFRSTTWFNLEERKHVAACGLRGLHSNMPFGSNQPFHNESLCAFSHSESVLAQDFIVLQTLFLNYCFLNVPKFI